MQRRLGFWALLLCAVHGQAAEFCVDNAVDLQAALTAAASNGQNDTVRLTSGLYIAPAGGFVYSSGEGLDLSLIGGHVQNTPGVCTADSNSALDTVLDGSSASGVLTLDGGFAAVFFSVSNLSFIDGAGGFSGAGGLSVYTGENFSASVRVQRCAFIGNSTVNGLASALYISGGRRIVVQDSLFTANEATQSPAIALQQAHETAGSLTPPGVQFINNSVVANVASNGSSLIAAGLKIETDDASAALVANNLFWDNVLNGTPFSTDLELLGSGTERHVRNNSYTAVLGQPAQFMDNVLGTAPQFVAAQPLNDFTLDWSAVQINRGWMPTWNEIPLGAPFLQSWALGTHDVLGRARVQDGRVEIGAFESPAEPWIFRNGFEALP